MRYFVTVTTKAAKRPIMCRYYEKMQNAYGEWNVLPRKFRAWVYAEKL